jgi:serine/threonine protein kinase
MIAGRYDIYEHLGTGGYGTVWRAREVVAGEVVREVAVKLMEVNPDDLASQLTELRQSLQLEHANLIPCYNCGECDVGPRRFLYLIMQLADGGSLLDRLRHAALSEADSLSLAEDLADGLTFLHSHGCVHRDLKPGNILRVGERWKIGDFGLARMLGASGARQRSTQFAGTPAYAPPEVYRNVPYNTAWDMWSLGVLLVEARSGRRPFRGNSDEELMLAVLRNPPDFYNLAGQLRAIAAGCLVQQPSDRLTIAQAILILRPSRPQTSPRRRVLPAAILFIAAAGAGALVYRGVVGKEQTVERPLVVDTKPPAKPPSSPPEIVHAPEPSNPATGGGAGPATPGERTLGPTKNPVAVAPTTPAPVMNPPPIEMPSRPRGGISVAPPSSVEPGPPVLRAPEFAFTLRAYKDDISASTPPFEAADARLTAMSATVRAFGAIPADTTATIRWLRRDSTSPTAREQEVGSISRSGAAIVGEHECPNKAILPGKYRVELLINGVPQPKAIEFSVKSF